MLINNQVRISIGLDIFEQEMLVRLWDLRHI
jgi:hypothetical protein